LISKTLTLLRQFVSLHSKLLGDMSI